MKLTYEQVMNLYCCMSPSYDKRVVVVHSDSYPNMEGEKGLYAYLPDSLEDGLIFLGPDE